MIAFGRVRCTGVLSVAVYATVILAGCSGGAQGGKNDQADTRTALLSGQCMEALIVAHSSYSQLGPGTVAPESKRPERLRIAVVEATSVCTIWFRHVGGGSLGFVIEKGTNVVKQQLISD